MIYLNQQRFKAPITCVKPLIDITLFLYFKHKFLVKKMGKNVFFRKKYLRLSLQSNVNFLKLAIRNFKAVLKRLRGKNSYAADLLFSLQEIENGAACIEIDVFVRKIPYSKNINKTDLKVQYFLCNILVIYRKL